MNELTRRALPRLGIVTLVVAAMMLSIALVVPLEAVAWWEWLALLGFVVTGIGLLLRARFGRVIAGLGTVAIIVVTVPTSVQLWTHVDIYTWDVTTVLAIANSIATTLLGLWLGMRALLVLIGRARPTLVTARVIGLMIVVVAVNHLWLAHLYGMQWRGGFSIRVSTGGTQLFGFPGWPIWHAAALVGGLALLGPRRWIAPATTALMGLAFALVPLMVVAMIATFEVSMLVFGTAMTMLVAYLAWWLRDEARDIMRA